MANINITGNVTLLKNTAVDSSGVAIAPTSLEYGQIAINYNAKDPCIFIKVLGDNGATSIQKFVGEAVIAKTLSDILGESAADLATLKDLIKQFEGSNNDVLTLVKNLTTEVGNKANTSDLNAHKNNTSNPHSVTKAQVGLANVDNTSDATKPISTATQTALDGKLGNTETAADSSKLGGIIAARYMRDKGSIQQSAFDTLSGTGIYNVINSSDIYRTLIQFDNQSGTHSNILQLWSGFNENSLKFRLKNGSTNLWDTWKHIWHSGNSNLSTVNWTMQDANIARTINQTCDSQRWLLAIKRSDDSHYRGIQSNGKDLSFWTNGANRINIDEIGNVFTKGVLQIGYGTNRHNVYIGEGDNEIALLRGGAKGSNGASSSNFPVSAFEQNGWNFTVQTGVAGQFGIWDATRTAKLLHIGSNGNVGIGYTTPAFKLDVNGSFKSHSVEINNHSSDGSVVFNSITPTLNNNCKIIHFIGKERSSKNGGTIAYKHVSYSSDSNYISLGMHSVDDILVATSGAKVGIGTSTPSYKLHVNGILGVGDVADSGTNRIACFYRSTMTNNSGLYLQLGKTNSAQNCAEFAYNHVSDGDYNNFLSIGHYGASDTNRAYFIANGRVGIGAKTPRAKLDVNGVIRTNEQFIVDSDANTAKMCIQVSNDKSFYLDQNFNLVAKSGCTSANTWNIISPSGVHMFSINAITGSTAIRNNLIVKGEAVTYSQDGVEAKTVAAASATRLADLEDVDLTGASDNFVLYRSNTTNANGDRVWKARSDAKSWSEISGKPTTFTPVDHNHIGGNYTTLSDERLKNNFTSLANPLNTILSINTYNFNWTEEALDKYHFIDKKSTGVKAQELQKILPELVNDIGDGTLSVDYIQIIPYLIDSVKQLNNELANKNIAIENARKDYKRAYGESVNLKKEMDALKLEVDEMKSLIKQNLI